MTPVSRVSQIKIQTNVNNVRVQCTWCSLSDDYPDTPISFKCPYCGNRYCRSYRKNESESNTEVSKQHI